MNIRKSIGLVAGRWGSRGADNNTAAPTKVERKREPADQRRREPEWAIDDDPRWSSWNG